MHIREWSVEVLTFINWSVVIVLTIHNLEIILKTMLNLLYDVALRSIWVNWLSSFPVISKLKIYEG